jgi:hypothetical protein
MRKNKEKKPVSIGSLPSVLELVAVLLVAGTFFYKPLSDNVFPAIAVAIVLALIAHSQRYDINYQCPTCNKEPTS